MAARTRDLRGRCRRPRRNVKIGTASALALDQASAPAPLIRSYLDLTLDQSRH
jgi:hypothetical protein